MNEGTQRYLVAVKKKMATLQIPNLAPEKITRYIDHTILKPEATFSDVERVCKEALEHHFMSVCVNPNYVEFASGMLKNSDIKVCTVVGFPLGASVTGTKLKETEYALRDGASEIDMVMNIGFFKSGEYKLVTKEIEEIVRLTQNTAIVKVIIETALLTDEEKVIATNLIIDSGAHFVKTSTGFGPGGATYEDIALLSVVANGKIGVKAAGGIRTKEQALKFIALGATRLGTSKGPNLLTD